MARSKKGKKAQKTGRSRNRWQSILNKHIRAASAAYHKKGNKKPWGAMAKAAFRAASREYHGR